MADTPIVSGRYLRDVSFLDNAIGAELYGEKDGQPWRLKVGEPNGLQTLDENGEVPLAQIPVEAATRILFTPAGTGAVDRAVEAKLRERVSVLDFIPVAEHAAIKTGTTTYDATINIQAAINAVSAGGALYFPDGVYRITAELTITTNGIAVVGASRRTTLIRQDTLNARVLNITGQYTCVLGLGITYGAGTPTAGATAIRSAALYCHYRDILILRSYTGIEFTIGGGQKLRDFEIFDYEFAGIHCISVNDVFIAGSILNAGNTSRGQGGGMRLEEKTEAIIVQDIDVLSGRYSMVTTSAAFSAGLRPAYNNFSNCFFDSSAEGVIIGNMVETEFVGCWSSGGRTGAGFPGWSIGQSVSLKFTNCRAFNNGSHGFQVSSNAARTRFVNCSSHSNSFTAGNGVAHGFNFTGASGFALIGCTSSNGLAAGSQGYGIALDASCANFSIRDCWLSGNQTGAISDATLDDGTVIKYIGGNIGYVTQKKGSSSVVVGQTVATVTHGLASTPSEADITISPTTLLSTAGISSWRILNFTSTTFQLQTNVAVAGSAFNFGWSARNKGA